MSVFRGIIHRNLFQSIKNVKNMSSTPNKKIGIIGCPFSKGQQKQGPEMAPQGEHKNDF